MRFRLALFVWLTATFGGHAACLAGLGGQLRVEVVDRDTQQPLACRMHLTNAAKRPLKAPKAPFWHDHFVFSGSITLKLPKGEYAFVIERGPEYLVRMGHFTIEDFSNDTKVVDLKRFVDMAAEGWWSGDLDVQRPAKDLELLMLADDLHVAELVTWPQGKNLLPKTGAKDPLVQFDGNRYFQFAAGRDSRAGGTLLFFNLPAPLSMAEFKPEYPPQLELIEQAKSQGEQIWVDAQKAYSWDLPLWVAAGKLDSIEIANSSLGRKTSLDSEAGGRPRDKFIYPAPTGNGRWTEKIYYHLLNCGLRIPPTAGSGSGDTANPVGYNRLYVHVEGDFTYEKWWAGLQAGRVMVSNGPLIRPNVEGEMPGHVFRAAAGQEVELEVGLTLSTRDKISYLEVVKDGELAHQIRLDEWQATGGKLPSLRFDRSGWFVLRAVADTSDTYRFATTAPYYVEIGYQRRVSKSSAQFFLDWINQRMKNLKLEDPSEREAVLKYHRQAQGYWQDLVDKANSQ